MKNLHRHTIPFNYNKKILYKSMDDRVFKDATLLTPGEWTDSVSRTPITYTDAALFLSANNWTKNILNLDHEWKVLNTIGTVQNPRYHSGSIRADLFVTPRTQNGKDAITLIDLGLVNALSIELMSNDTWDSDDFKRYATDIEYLGCAMVYGDNAACSEAKVK